MLACGLPVVDLDVPSTRSTFGLDGPIRLSHDEPLSLCECIEVLLGDVELRARHARLGPAFATERLWPRAATKLARELRALARSPTTHT
jgi:hypothetical protein